MKNLKKLVVIALMLAVGGQLAAYTFNFTNKTGQDLKVWLFWGAGSPLNTKYSDIKKGKTRKFSWTVPSGKAGLCLNGIRIQRMKNGKWTKKEKIKLVRKEVPSWVYPVATVATGGIGGVTAGFVEAGFQCGNQNFDLIVDAKTKKIVAVKK